MKFENLCGKKGSINSTLSNRSLSYIFMTTITKYKNINFANFFVYLTLFIKKTIKLD